MVAYPNVPRWDVMGINTLRSLEISKNKTQSRSYDLLTLMSQGGIVLRGDQRFPETAETYMLVK